jgi:Tol biopolymer transport system component/DNA-binding winged helix-turn-helix (wHTH) protein
MPSLFHFADFELDLNRYELRRAGRALKLERIPMDLLVLFVEQRDRLVTREEIAGRIWGKEVFVDTENSINTAVRKIRTILKDDPGKPKFLETVSGKGYRFIAQVTTADKAAKDLADPPTAGPLQADLTVPVLEPGGSPHPHVTHPGGWRRTRYMVLMVASLAVTALLAFVFAPAPQLRVARYDPLTSDVQDKGGPLLTDGVRVYFLEKGPHGTTLASVPVAGGGTGLITLPESYKGIYDLSPFRSELLGGRSRSDQEGGDLSVIPMLGGSPRRISDLHANAANWSPDGKQIAFALHKNLYISNADGSQSRKIAEISGQALWLRWSPDGKTLRFTENDYHNGEVWESIWEIGSDGSNLRRLLDGWNNPPHECCGSWTPDGRFFVFQATRDGRTDLWTLSGQRDFLRSRFRRDFGTPVLLSSGLQGFLAPVVSIDGRQVFAVGIEKRGELVRYDSKLREFVPFLGGISATWVSFSKSEHSVAYINYPDQTLWRANSGGAEKTQITFAPLQVDGFSWSPNEQWFALRARAPGKPWMIYLVPSQGGDAQLIMPGEAEQGVPTWSEDGRSIAFGDVPSVFGKSSGTEAIHIFDLNTRKLTELPGSRGLWTARWSPNGKSLAALTIEGQQLMLYDFGTKKWRTTRAENVNNPTWSHDGKYIYFDTEGDDRALRRVLVADGHVDQLTSLHAYPNLAWWWSGVTPDNSPLILRNLGANEIYSLILEFR